MNEQLSFNATIEIDQAQSMKNIKKVVDDIGKSTAIEIKGFNIDPNTLSKQLQSAMKQTFNFNKDTGLNSLTSVIKGAYGEILTVQQSVDEHGKTIIENAKLTTDALKAQKTRYEEIRALYEKLGKLQVENMTASKKKQEEIANEVKETRKLIRQKEKALKTDESMINNSLQESVIEKQKLKNAQAIAREEEKINQRRLSAYTKLQKAMELIHKYELQSIGASEKDLAILERKKSLAKTMQNSAQGTINRTGLSDNKLNEQIAQTKEIQALELSVAKQKAEEKALNTELVQLENQRIATKKQLETVNNSSQVQAVLEKQLEEQALAVFQKRAEIEQKGLSTQQAENVLAQKRLDLENQIEVAKAKQIASAQKEEEQIKKLIANTQKSMGITATNALNKNSKYITTEDIVAIDKFQQRLKNLNGTSLQGVKDQIAKLRLEWKEIDSNLQANRLKQTSTAMGELGQSFKNLATYVSGAMVIRQLWNELSNGIQHIKDVDQAFTNMSMTMQSLTEDQFDNMLDKVNTMSKEMGAVSSEVLQIAQTFANDSVTIEEVMAKLNPSVALMNVSGMGATEVTKSIMSIANSYQMLEEGGTNAAEVTEYLGDVLAKVSANMDMDFQEGLQGLVSGIGVAGSTMKAAGVDMEWFVGQLGNAMVATGQSSEKLGRGMRTIAARVMQQKQALEELGESTENIELVFAQGEAALKQLGITIRDNNTGALKSFSSIMDELGEKWENLSDSTKYYLAEQLAGKNQMDIFIGMMDSYGTALGLVEGAYESQGTLMEMNGIYAESLEGKLNSLKSAQQELYQTFVNTDGYKSMIDGFTGIVNALTMVIDTFGAVPTAVFASTMAFTSFNNAGKLMRDNVMQVIPQFSNLITKLQLQSAQYKNVIDTQRKYIDLTTVKIQKLKAAEKDTTTLTTKLNGFNTTLKASQLQLVATTAKTVALQTVMSMGLSLAIGAVVGGLTTLMSSLKKTDVDMNSVATSVKNLTDAMNVDESGLLSEYERLTKLSQEEGKTTKEIAYYNEELKKVKNELLGLDDKYASILNDETISLETQLNLMKAQRELRLKEQATDINDTLGKDGKYNEYSQQLEDSLKADYELITRYQQMIDEAIANKSGVVVDAKTGVERSFEEATQILNEAKERFEGTFIEGMERNSALEAIQEVGVGLGKELVGLQDGYENLFNTIKNEAETVSNAITGGAEDPTSNVADKINALTTTFKALGNEQLKYADTIQDIRGTIQELGGDAEKQTEVVRQFLEVFPEFEGAIEDVDDVLAALGDKATIELAKAQEQARSFLETMKDSENYTGDFAQQLLDAYPELIGHIQDTAYVQEFLNDKIAEMDGLYGVVMSQVDVHRTAQEEILANDAEFWNQKMKNSENFVQYQNAIESKLIQMGADSLGIQYADFAAFVESKGGLRDVDYTNATTLAEAENMTEAQKLMSMLQLYAQYVNEKDGYRGADSELILDFLNWQGDSEAGTIQELKEMWATYYNAKKAEISKEIDDMRAVMGGDYSPELNAKWDALQKLNKQMSSGTLFNGIKTTFKGTGTSYKGGNLGSSGLNTKPLSSSSNSSKDKQDTEQVVEDLELVIDRYYELNDAIDDVNNKLELNRQLQANAKDMNTVKKLHKEEIALLNEKVKAMEKLQLEQRNDMLDQKNKLSSAGFKFDKEGNITNYSSQLKAMQDYANSLKGEAKEAQIAYVQSIVEVIDAYTTLTNDSLPSTELALEQLQEEIEKVNKEHEKTIQLIETLGDRYYEINGQIADVDNKLALVRAKQENATPSERVKLMKEEIALMKQRQQLIAQQKSELETEANEIAKQLAEKGVEFNADGTIKNYKQLMENLTTVANQYVGDTRDEMVEDAESLLDLIEQYDDIIRETLPELAVEWEEYTSSIREAEKAMAEQVTEVQKNVTSAIENELQKRTEAVKKELEKQKDAYNKQFDEEDWEDSLSEEQRKLDEIQQAINNMSRDTSLAGQLKLQQLREEYEAQQKVIDDMIRDKEKENGNNRFDEEMEKLDQELEEALDPQNIADLVNKALVDGFVTIGDEVVALDSLMSDWLNETGDGLYAIGDTLREELIDNLRVAQELMAGMGIIQTGVSSVDQNALLKDAENQLSATLNTSGVKGQGQNLEIAIGSLLEVKGNVTEDVLPKLESMIETAKSELIEEITYEMMRR